jgi:sialic acid synthase SpsE
MVFLVGEIGVNWDGDLDIARELMMISKENNLDAVKFQSFSKEIVSEHPLADKLLESSISSKNIYQIDNLAKEIGIEWFATPMYVEAVNLLNPFVKRFKIREFDARPLAQNKTNDLIEKIFQTQKDVIISSQSLPSKLNSYQNKIDWLYCVPKYPCLLNDLDFSKLSFFNGFSNHCQNIIAPLTAAILGTNIIEIHITIDKKRNFVDNHVSFDPNELKQLTNFITLSKGIKK